MVAAASFAICNVLSKLVLAAGSDVLTLSLFRGLVGVALLFIWLKAVSLPSPLTPRTRLISLGLGLLFAGVVFGLFAAISSVTVPIAVLTLPRHTAVPRYLSHRARPHHLHSGNYAHAAASLALVLGGEGLGDFAMRYLRTPHCLGGVAAAP